MDKEINNKINFHNFIQYLTKDEKIKKQAYTLKAIVSYKTDKEDFSFYNEEHAVIVTTDSQKIGSVYIPDIDENRYFSDFVVIYQDFNFDEKKEELIITSRKPTSYKEFSTYEVTIRNMIKTDNVND